MQVGGQLQQKARKLSVSNDTYLTDKDARRVVHNPDDPLSPYGLFLIIRKMSHLDQEYVFCHDMTLAHNKLLVSFDKRFLQVKYDPRERMGEKTIGNFAKVLNKRCRIPNFQKFTNHCWRTWMITRLANCASVNDNESMSYSRHSSATSQLPYVRRGENSSVAFQKALQTVKYPSGRSILCRKKAPPVKPNKKGKQIPTHAKSHKSVCMSPRVSALSMKESTGTRMVTRSILKKY